MVPEDEGEGQRRRSLLVLLRQLKATKGVWTLEGVARKRQANAASSEPSTLGERQTVPAERRRGRAAAAAAAAASASALAMHVLSQPLAPAPT